MKVVYRKLYEDALIPKQQTNDAACADIYAHLTGVLEVSGYTRVNNSATYKIINTVETHYIELMPRARVLIPTGWAVKVPHGYSMRIYSRSGIALKQGLVVFNGTGVIDSDYRHQVYVIIHNSSDSILKINHGDRIAQLDFTKNLHNSLDCDTISCDDATWFEADNSRVGGFGSTGV